MTEQLPMSPASTLQEAPTGAPGADSAKSVGMTSQALPVPTASPLPQGKGASRGWVGLGLALSWLLAAAALMAAIMLWQRVSDMQRQLARQITDAGTRSIEARTLSQQAADGTKDNSQQLAALQGRVNDLTAYRAQLDEMIQNITRVREESLASELETNLRVAQNQAQITGSIDPLLSSLYLAQRRLSQTLDPRLTPVSKALAADLERVKAASMPDTEGLLSRLDQLLGQIDDLPAANGAWLAQEDATKSMTGNGDRIEDHGPEQVSAQGAGASASTESTGSTASPMPPPMSASPHASAAPASPSSPASPSMGAASQASSSASSSAISPASPASPSSQPSPAAAAASAASASPQSPQTTQATQAPSPKDSRSKSPQAPTPQSPNPQPPNPKEPTLLSQWGQWLHDSVWLPFKQSSLSLVRVERIDKPDAMMMAPEQVFFVRENLKLRLQGARLAILARQFPTARDDLAAAQRAIGAWFDPNAHRTQSAAALLEQIEGQTRAADLPRIDETIAALDAAQALIDAAHK